MAPARMMQFADKHIKFCATCQQDSDLVEEIEKIRAFVLPESKIPKSERDDEDATPDISPDEEDIEDEDIDEEDDEDDEDEDSLNDDLEEEED